MRNEIITYSVNKTNDRELYISVQNGEVLVRAPWYITKEKIQEAVTNKKNWIMKKLKEYQEENEISLRPIQIMGIVYNLKVSYKNINVIECNMENNIIKINLPKKYKKIDNETMTDIVIDKMYFKIAERELESIMEKTRLTLGFAPEDYEIVEIDKNAEIPQQESPVDPWRSI